MWQKTAEFEAGWRIYAANEATERLSLSQAVSVYRDQIIEESIFRRLHGKMLSITPLYVQRENHAQGLIHLLTLGARVLALGDYLGREALAKDGNELAGVHTLPRDRPKSYYFTTTPVGPAIMAERLTGLRDLTLVSVRPRPIG